LKADPRLKGLVYLDPFHVEQSLKDLVKYGGDPAFVGVGEVRPDYHRLPLDSPRYEPLIEKALDLDLPILTHTDESTGKVARKYPSLKLVTAHANIHIVRLYKDALNICFCTTASSSAWVQDIHLEEMVEEAGAGRILYGSDGPLHNPAWEIGKFESANLSEADKRLIYYENAIKTFPRIKQ